MARITGLYLKYADWLASIWFLVLTYLSISPLPELPEVPGGDKALHLIAYALLAFLGTTSRKTYKGIVLLAFAFAVYGGFVEIIQPHVNRYGEFGDFVASAIGVIIGTILVLALFRKNQSDFG